MKNAFEPSAGSGVGKHTASHFIAAQPAIGPGDLRPEGRQNFRQGRLAGFNDLARKVVSVHHRDTTRTEKLGRGRLSHADPAS
jgi:hypothetical protein